ncbi:beta strand repeat-containing protein [Novipirellula artificiosorum]|uniref:GEVED domain-containing protein n=1 Tax=Novipirellula artificiosorum TaxID=2528016 RepID=A0A5C6DZI1_9BACT|nr:GEVED domain-containing protein [Novipirellula artificiosorum]TWU42048.1 hypothetical protein Poly41_03440 [Novipirellula artificiosorum]
MTNRKSSVRDGIQESIRNLTGRLRSKRRRQERRLLSESLESRQLLAGPELVGVQSNEGDLFRDFETLVTDSLPSSVPELNVSPRELIFRFDGSADLDLDSLQGITITSAGSDGFFEAASATNDLGTGGTVLVEYRATSTGISGNGTTIVYKSSDRGSSGTPVVTSVDVSGASPVITLDLNRAPGRPANVADLVSAVNTTASVNQYVTVQQVTGASLTKVGLTVDTSHDVVLTGANSAQAVTDLGTGGEVRVRLTATRTGANGTGTTIVVKQRNYGGQALPLVLVDASTVEVQVNSSVGFETTVDEFLTAINSNLEAASLVTGTLEFGDGDTLMGNRAPTYSPLVMTGASDSVIEPGYVGFGDSSHEVVFRFAEALPDDTYRIDINAAGVAGLRNEEGEYFNDGISVTGQFRVNQGPQVLAVVPQPVARQADGTLNVAANVIEVHVDGGDINVSTLETEDFYRLIYTRDSVSTADDVQLVPSLAKYNSTTKVVRLEFPHALSRVPDPTQPGAFLAGAARLRVGSSEPIHLVPDTITTGGDVADNFSGAFNLNSQWTISTNPNAGIQSAHLGGEILNTVDYDLQLPGGSDVPGTRDLRPDDPSRLSRTIPLDVLRRGADSDPGIAEYQYDFVGSWQGDDPTKPGLDETRTYFNLITEQQKARVREVLSLFSEYLGVQFVETTGGLTSDTSFSIAVGELYGADARVNSAAALTDANGDVILGNPESIVVATRDRNLDGFDDLAVLDGQDFDDSDDDALGGEFFRGAFLAVGQLLGYGYADHLPQPVTQSTASVLAPGTDNEPAFPSVADIVNGQYMYRPESNDIDVYRFSLSQPGAISIETLAERLPTSSLLNTALRLYKLDPVTGTFTEVAANDDYFSSDSLIELDLAAGTYAVGVSASGNNSYDPATPGSGFGGLSQGAYELNLSFRASAADRITDTSGNALDGDLDGDAGGLFNFWFVPNDPNTTLYVDKAAPNPDLNRATPNPYLNLDDAIAAARPGDTIRVVGNGGTDGDVSTVTDNFAYQIGKDNRGIALPDGDSVVVPQGVNLVVDAGAVFKMRRSRVGIGSTAPLVDTSNASLQILGTPTLIGASGRPLLDINGNEIPGSVIFTSFNDDLDAATADSASPGDWGGIDFRGDLDSADQSRQNLEEEGVFLNHLQYADLRYGGGQVSVDGRQVVVNPIDMAITRPTIINSSVRLSADAAMAATPDTFRESRFTEARLSGADFTPDYSRVGPQIHGNVVVDNTINGLFVRVATRTGGVLQPLTVNARFDDTDIVHVLTENLQIVGNAGGPIESINAPNSLLIRVSDRDANGDLLTGNVLAGEYQYRVTFADSSGRESDPSQPTTSYELTNEGAMRLSGLPTLPASSSYTSRRLYRAIVGPSGQPGQFLLVGTLNASATTFVDSAIVGTDSLPTLTQSRTARPDPGLKLDPGTVLKMQGARIDVTLGSHFYAEGTTERPVVMTSLSDARYGAGGTFDTNASSSRSELQPGDWAGLYVGFGGSASIDHATIAGGGGTARIPGGFASFNTIEVHQGDLRLANSRMEQNADGRGFVNPNEPDRGGRGDNASGTVFVLASQPVIVNTDFLGGFGPMASFDVNSFSFEEMIDPGRATGSLDAISSVGNSGPLLQGNRSQANPDDPSNDSDAFGLNGVEVRGGSVSTEVVLDDVDVVHIVRESIEIPNQHIYGGMRLESDARGSLVVKFQGESAGIVAGGSLATAEEQFQDIADRIGGSLQIVGHPDFPVVLTALVDDTIGAGFTPDGLPALDTNADGIRTTVLTSEGVGDPLPPGLPLGPEYDRTDSEVNNATLIDNDLDPNLVGFFEATILDGTEVDTISATGIEQATGNLFVQQNYAFLATTFVDVEVDPGTIADPAPFRLINSTITRAATLVDDDTVVSEGTFLVGPFQGETREFQWTATSFILDNRAVLYTTVEFVTSDGQDINAGAVQSMQVTSYMSHGAGANNQDILYRVGSAGEQDFRAYIIDNQSRFGFSHGGIYENDGINQTNATFNGWTGDDAARLLTAINAENLTPSITGDIDAGLPALPNDPLFPNATSANGLGDIATAFTWTLNPSEDNALVTSFVEWIPSDPADPFDVQLPITVDGSGSWDGVTIREAADDRNVASTSENEPRNVGVSDTNPTPGQSQYLGEIAPNKASGDENRRIGFIVDGSVSSAGDIDVYSFIGEAGTLVWMDIDRTDLRLDTVLELIDANGNTLVLSDDSLAESMGTKNRLTGSDGRFDADNARSLNQLSADDPTLTPADHQDLYSSNPRDAGMRVILPGEAGQRNLYHVRVRSSSVESGSNGSLVVSGQTQNQELSSLRRGLTSGGYQLQLRLQEVDEHAGTQIRYSDVRYAVNGVQVIGGPLHSPLAGDEYEVDAPNDTLGSAQVVGLFSTTEDAAASTFGPLSSDSLSKSIGGVMSGLTDVDWYQFDINYDDLTRDNAAMYLATAFDLDYSDGLARANTALYVFNAAGQLILVGSDSNVADDQPLGNANASDLSRGSFGTGDPFIGSSELAQGTYFVAVSNQQQVPQPLDQFFNRNTDNPLLRLEPIDSVQRLAGQNFDGYYGSTAGQPTIPLLFDNESLLDYAFDDMMLYVNTGSSLVLVNPFTGNRYGTVGNFTDEIRDVAFRGNGELFAYSGFDDRAAADDAWFYYRISTEDATLSAPLSVGAEIITYHDQAIEAAPGPQVLDQTSNDGIEVEAIAIGAFRGSETGFFVGNRPIARQGLEYSTNILYGFNEEDGVATGTAFDLLLANAGAGTDPTEIGQINTTPQSTQRRQLGFTAATATDAQGISSPSLFDGDRFTLTNVSETVTFEFDQGYTLIVSDFGSVAIGDRVSITLPGQSPQVFEFVTDPALVTAGNVPVVISTNLGPEEVAKRLADTIRGRGIPISAAGTQMSLPTAEAASVQVGVSSSLSLSGEPGVGAGNYRIPLFPTDTSAVIANRIIDVIDQANTAGDLPSVSATVTPGVADPRSVEIIGGFIGDPVNSPGSLPTGNLTAGGLANGGFVTGIDLMGDRLFAVSNTGGLYVVNGSELATAPGSRTVGSYVTTATDLIGLNFTGLRAGPDSVQDGELNQLLFGITFNGTIHAFNTRGELQPVFAGGRTSISTGVGGALGLDFSTLDYSLWHTTGTRGLDLGHGLNEIHSDTRIPGADRITGSNSLAFNYEQFAFGGNYTSGAERPVIFDGNGNIVNPRQDGADVTNTYNFPGGAKGVVQSNTIDLSEFSSNDLPTLYFNYFLENDGVDEDATDPGVFREDRDSLRVYVVDQEGVEHLVASNSEAREAGSFDDEFDDPAPFGIYDDDIDTDVQQLFDNADGTWRQARVPLGAFAGQSGLSLRIEYATAGTTQTGTLTMRTVAADQLVENSQIVVNGEVFAIDFAPSVYTPSGRELSKVYAANATAVGVIRVDGQDYVLNDGTRPVAAGQISVDLLSAQPTGTMLEDLSAATIATLVADTIDMTRLVPSGAELALLYTDPNEVYVVDYAGVEYVLNDGGRPVGVDQVSVDLTALGKPIAQLSQMEVAEAFSMAAGVPLPQFNVVSGFYFSDPSDDPLVSDLRNDLLFEATVLPYVGGNSTIVGAGRLGTVDLLGNATNLDDVDLLRAEVAPGTTISVDVDLDTNPSLSAAIRFFDVNGDELPKLVDSINDTVETTLTNGGVVYIGISGLGNVNYDPRIDGTASTGQIDSYTASVQFLLSLDVTTDGNMIEVPGAAEITSSSAILMPTSGQEILAGHPIRVSRTASATEVAAATSQAIADRYTGGDTSIVPASGSSISLAAFTVNDFGPFVNANERYGDRFGEGNLAGSRDNAFEGVYLDDFIIGFAERGEIVTASRAVATDETFIADGTRDFTTPSQPTQPTVTGAYQLEIRDASEYVQSASASRFRTFDTNDRLSEGYVLTALAGSAIVDGATFTVSGLGADLTFEFDLFNDSGVSDGLNAPTSDVAIRVAASATEREAANAIINALMSTDVTQLLDIAATGANGNLGFQQSQADLINMLGDRQINVYGDVVITSEDGTFAETNFFDLRGDSNRQSSDQGIILIENSRFAFNSDAGIDLNRASQTDVQGVEGVTSSPSVVTYPRNLVELNTDNLLPGVVVQSNVLAFNSGAGIRITGLSADGGTLSDPVAFDRILNNTIVGGTVNRSATTFPEVYGDQLFDKGDISFADSVASFTVGANVTSGFDNPDRALGVPDSVDGAEPVDGDTTVSLGTGGVLTVGFTDNFLTGSGDARPDLVVFETGAIEGVSVEVSRDGTNFINVGVIAGIDSTIDLDAFGFNAQDRFAFVRLTDLGQGTATSGPVGADIDAVGALSAVGADIYIPGSKGLVVQQGAAPTLLNNVVANTQTALSVDSTSLQTVVGGTTYYRNATDAQNSQAESTGLYPQVLADAQELFVDPVQLVFTPRAGAPIIDSSIDSLEDRSSLSTVRSAIGLPPSPIISPRLDVNGQLRVDDPLVETPPGIGESVFKDRGAEDRADEVGPRAVLISPRAPDIGLDGGQVVTVLGDIYSAFDIQLIDGIAGADPTPGVGIDDASVTGDALLVTRDGQTLVEGEDYAFGYDPSNNVIRLTPLAGIWQDDSVYVVRLLDSTDAVLRIATGDTYTDGQLTTVIGLDGSFTTLEVDTGINITVSPDLFGAAIDGKAITLFDGSIERTFELDTDGNVGGANAIAVSVPETASVPQLATALADSINASGLNLNAIALDNRVQLLGDSTLATATPLSDVFSVTVTNIDLTMTTALVGAANGEAVTVSDGLTTAVFEFDTDGIQNVFPSIQVPVLATDSTQQLAEALNTAIVAAGLNLTSQVVNNRVELRADSPFATASTTTADITITTEITGPSIGTSVGFGLRVPNEGAAVADTVTDGQTFVIRRGASLSRTFELNLSGGLDNPDAIPVTVNGTPTLDSVAEALVRAIGGAGLGLDPANAGDGRVTLGGDANYSIDLTNTTLEQIASAGQQATVPVVIAIDATRDEVAQLYTDAIESLGLDGVSISVVGDRLVIDGIATVTGSGAVVQPIIRDDVGNLLQSNTDEGTTELVIFVGGGADYGDAPAPYLSLDADNGPKHNVIENLYLGRGVTPDADAQLPDADRLDDGVRVSNALRPGFTTTFLVDINLPADATSNVAIPAPGVFYLDAWFDWNANGLFELSEVQRFGSVGSGRALVGVGAGNSLSIAVPDTAKPGSTFARFRISEDGALGSRGFADSGEVEDFEIFVSSNPYRNPLNRNDVNNSGEVTPIDALQIINALNRAGVSSIPLDQFPLPTDLPPFPDTNSNGVVTAADALSVINELNSMRNTFTPQGEQVATSYVPAGNGVFASGATAVGDLLVAEATSQSNAVIATESVAPLAANPVSKVSVFDSAAVMSLDSVVDTIAEDTAEAKSDEDPVSVLDKIFANMD